MFVVGRAIVAADPGGCAARVDLGIETSSTAVAAESIEVVESVRGCVSGGKGAGATVPIVCVGRLPLIVADEDVAPGT